VLKKAIKARSFGEQALSTKLNFLLYACEQCEGGWGNGSSRQLFVYRHQSLASGFTQPIRLASMICFFQIPPFEFMSQLARRI